MKGRKGRRLISPSSSLELVNLQVERALEMYQSQLSMLVQSLTVFILGDITLIGFAVSQQSSGILAMGLAFPIIAFYLIRRTDQMLVAMLFTAFSLEQRYGGADEDWLASTLFATANSSEALTDLRNIMMEPDYQERIKKLRLIHAPPFRKGLGLIRIAILLATLGHMISPPILNYFFNWKLF